MRFLLPYQKKTGEFQHIIHTFVELDKSGYGYRASVAQWLRGYDDP